MRKLAVKLAKMSLPEREAVPGIGPRRAEIIVAGAAVFAEIFETFSLAGFRYSPLGLRDGILAQTQDVFARSETNFLRSLVKSSEGHKAAAGWAVASDKSVVARAMYEVMTTDLRPKLHEIKTPVTVLYPWDPSTGMTQAACDGLYRESFAPLTNKTMVRIDGSFHFIMFDQPEAFAAQVDAFLK